MDHQRQLRTLRAKLAGLVDVLALDPKSQWKRKFESDLAQSQALLLAGGSRDEAISLAKSITDVYGGMGSFNDYAPTIYDAATGRYSTIPGAEAFDRLSNEVFEAALALRSR